MSEDFGTCPKCGDQVLGAENGCQVKDEVYHVDCFTCCACSQKLYDKQFYTIDDKRYCEEDYLETLDKCVECSKPISERILRAKGKTYHPDCFRCKVCSKTLSNSSFALCPQGTVHCIEDYHKKFAPRCSVCRKPIMPEPGTDETVRVVILDRSFHVDCYRCEDCNVLLSSESEGHGCFPLDGHILCRPCSKARAQLVAGDRIII